MPPHVPERQLARARAMRREQTGAEEILWRSLRNRGIGAKFRRQVPIGPFIVGFASLSAKIVVEVDGPTHEDPEQQAHDQRRDAWLSNHGWRVIRVSNELVIGGGEIALDRVRALLQAIAPSSDPC